MSSLLNTYLARWQLSLEGEPLLSQSGMIAFVLHKGRPLVLKIPHKHSDETLMGRVLEYYNGNGCVQCYKFDQNAMLLERIIPGTSLVDLVYAGEDNKATEIFCTLLGTLHTKKLPDHCNFKSFVTLEALGKAFADYLASDDIQLPVALVEHAQDVYQGLIASQDVKVLLHRDLHHHNILKSDERGWLAIDPKGVIGEAVFEVGAFMINPMESPGLFSDKKIVENRLAIIRERLPYTEERIIGWSFCYSILAACWQAEDNIAINKGLIEFAEILKLKL